MFIPKHRSIASFDILKVSHAYFAHQIMLGEYQTIKCCPAQHPDMFRAYSISACSPHPASTGNSLYVEISIKMEFAFKTKSNQPTIIRLTIAMVFDLGLNRTCTGDSDVPEMLGDSTKSFNTETAKPLSARQRDERRTMLLVYYSTAMYVILDIFQTLLTRVGYPGV